MKRAFTLIELVISLVIIGLIIGFIAPTTGSRIDEGRTTQIKAVHSAYRSKFESYKQRAKYEIDKTYQISSGHGTVKTVVFSSTGVITDLGSGSITALSEAQCEDLLKIFANLPDELVATSVNPNRLYDSATEGANGCRFTHQVSGQYFIHNNANATILNIDEDVSG